MYHLEYGKEASIVFREHLRDNRPLHGKVLNRMVFKTGMNL